MSLFPLSVSEASWHLQQVSSPTPPVTFAPLFVAFIAPQVSICCLNYSCFPNMDRQKTRRSIMYTWAGIYLCVFLLEGCSWLYYNSMHYSSLYASMKLWLKKIKILNMTVLVYGSIQTINRTVIWYSNWKSIKTK